MNYPERVISLDHSRGVRPIPDEGKGRHGQRFDFNLKLRIKPGGKVVAIMSMERQALPSLAFENHSDDKRQFINFVYDGYSLARGDLVLINLSGGTQRGGKIKIM